MIFSRVLQDIWSNKSDCPSLYWNSICINSRNVNFCPSIKLLNLWKFSRNIPKSTRFEYFFVALWYHFSQPPFVCFLIDCLNTESVNARKTATDYEFFHPRNCEYKSGWGWGWFSRLVRFASQWIKLKRMNFDESKAVFRTMIEHWQQSRLEVAINLKFSSIVNRDDNLFRYMFSNVRLSHCKSTVCRKLKCFSFAGMKNYAKYPKRLGLCNNLQFCLPSTSTYEFMISCVLGFGGGWSIANFTCEAILHVVVLCLGKSVAMNETQCAVKAVGHFH